MLANKKGVSSPTWRRAQPTTLTEMEESVAFDFAVNVLSFSNAASGSALDSCDQSRFRTNGLRSLA